MQLNEFSVDSERYRGTIQVPADTHMNHRRGPEASTIPKKLLKKPRTAASKPN